MRINQQTRFPHPVLSEETQDYTVGSFSVGLRVSESRTTGKVTIDYTVSLAEPTVEGLIEGGQAMLGLFIVCRRTYYNELHRIENGSGLIEFSKGELRDNVVFRPVVCAIEGIEHFSTPSLHREYGEIEWSFRPSDILALGEDIQIDVGLDKLAPMETIFELVTDDDVPNGETRVLLEREKIGISANKETRKGLHAMRGSGVGRLALLNGVYLPAVMEVLAAVSEDVGSYENYRWFSVFSAKCSHLGIDFSKSDLIADAQKLLRSPLGRLLSSKEFNPS